MKKKLFFNKKTVAILNLIYLVIFSAHAAVKDEQLGLPDFWTDPSVTGGSYRFDSTNGNNENKYTGSLQTYHVGLWKRFSNNAVGLSFNRDNTVQDSHLTLNNVVNNTNQKTHSNNITATIYHYFTPYIEINGFAGGSDDNYYLAQTSETPVQDFDLGNTVFHGSQYAAGAGGSVSIPIKKVFTISGIGNYAFVRVNKDEYTIGFGDNLSINPPLNVETENLTEQIKLTLTARNALQPYADVGFLQVLSTRTHPEQAPIVITTGGLPVLEVSDNGINYGGGININYRSLSGNVGFDYYKRGSEYTSPIYRAQLTIPILQ